MPGQGCKDEAAGFQGMARRILIVSHHFYPEAQVGAKRMSELARHLCDDCDEVVVITARAPAAACDQSLQLRLPGLRQIRIPLPPKLLPFLLPRLRRLRGENGRANATAAPAVPGSAKSGRESLLAKAKRFYFSLEWLIDDKKLWSFLVTLRLYGFLFAKPFDAVISSGPPMSAHLAVLLGRPILRGRWVLDLRDPWCDQSERSHVESRFSRWCNRRLEARVIAAADAVTVTTPSYRDLLRQRYPRQSSKIWLILNGYDRPPTHGPASTGRLQLLYAGTLYYNRDPFPLLRAVRELVDDPEVDRSKVSVRLVGDCDRWNDISLTDWIEANRLQDCVHVEPWAAPDTVAQLMAEANVLIAFAQGQPLQIPAKMFDYLAARREILLIAEPDSDAAWLARQSDSARIVAPGDEAAMGAALRALYRDYVTAPRRPQRLAAPLDAFSRRAQNAHFLDLLREGAVIEQEVES